MSTLGICLSEENIRSKGPAAGPHGILGPGNRCFFKEGLAGRVCCFCGTGNAFWLQDARSCLEVKWLVNLDPQTCKKESLGKRSGPE